MPRKLFTANKSKEKSTKPKPSSKNEDDEKYFDETITILESDDDFVIPNPKVVRIRKRVSKASKSKASSFAIYESDSSSSSFNEAGTIDDVSEISSAGFGSDRTNFQKQTGTTFINLEDYKVPKIILQPEKEEEIKNVVIKTNKAQVDEINNFTVNSEVQHTHNTNTTNDSWKGLMQLMQSNQKKSTIKPGNKSKTFWKSTKSLQKKPANNYSTLTFNASRNNTIFIEESPPKRLKLDILNMDETDAIDPIDSGSIYKSTSTTILTEQTVLNDESIASSTIASSTSTNVFQGNVTIPSMFLKPSERAALQKIQKINKINIQDDLCEALKLLSTEPENFKSVKIRDDMFDGNTVKLNACSDLPELNKTKTCPFYKKIPGTRFSVDAFNYGIIPGVEVYFLSHFHSDHYIGLTKKFCKTLICSPPTANLVQMKMNLEEKCIRRLQINTRYIIDGVEVTLITANHCPGSVMFVFRLPNGITYFHTGDFRFTTDMLNNHILQGLCKVDCLYLDTTYCDPQYDFPTQQSAIAELIIAVKERMKTRPKTLIICGSYVIGKERVYFSLAEAIKAKVFMNYDKRRVIHCLENPRYLSYLADKEDAASIHVHQMFSINPKFLYDYLSTRSGKYTHIIGIKPTGWQFSTSGDGATIKHLYNDTVTTIGVPYSEHSSFSELEQFVRALKPRKVQPTVNVGNTSKREAMMQHIENWLK